MLNVAKNWLSLTACFVLHIAGIAPSIGDVRLHNFQVTPDQHYTGHAQIYLTNGSNENMWSEVCNTESFDDNEIQVFCKQLNFTNGKKTTTNTR